MEALVYISGLLAAVSLAAVGIGYAGSAGTASGGASGDGKIVGPTPPATADPGSRPFIYAGGTKAPVTIPTAIPIDAGPSRIAPTSSPESLQQIGADNPGEIAIYLDEFGIGTSVAEEDIQNHITTKELQAQVYPGYVARGGGAIKPGEKILAVPWAPTSAPISVGTPGGTMPTNWGVVVRSAH